MKVEAMFDGIASGEDVQTANFADEDRIDAPLDRETVQAWVAYARQHHSVTLDMERLKDRIGEYYVGLREQSKGSGAPVNLRKAGSALRYAIASAKIRLGDRVTDEDIERGIEIVSLSLSQIGLTDDGEWSVDVEVAQKVSQAESQAERKESFRGLVESLETRDAGADVNDILTDAQEELSMTPTAVEQEIEKMMDKGELYEPQQGEYRLT